MPHTPTALGRRYAAVAVACLLTVVGLLLSPTTASPAAAQPATSSTSSLRIATWNVQRGHDPQSQARGILRVFAAQHLDVMLTQETGGYLHALRAACRLQDCRVISRRRGGHAQAAIVRAGLRVHGVRAITGGGTWRTTTGALHSPTYALVARVGGVLIVNVHAPVSVRWRRDGRIDGPPRRVAAYRRHQQRIRRLLDHNQGGPVVVAGDWNARHEGVRGPYSPAWLARVTGSRVRSPGWTVDYALTRGVRVSGLYRHRNPRSVRTDHRMVSMVVRARR